MIKQLMDVYSDTFKKRDRMQSLSEDLVSKLNMLEGYRNNHYIYAGDTFYTAILAVAEENNLFDAEVYPIYQEIKKFLERYPFVETLCDVMPYYQEKDDKMANVLRDLFKYHKRRLDWKNYNIKLNDDVVTTELTEEIIDELQD